MKITNLEKSVGNFYLQIKSMNIKEGYIHGFIGGNGCGKTTLAKVIMGILNMDGGAIEFEQIRKKDMTMTSQRPYLLHTTVYQNIIYPLQIRKLEVNETKIDEWLATFGMLEKKHQYARSLSSGERQKISLIRAMIFEPQFVIIDETISNLDIESVELFEQIILRGQKENPITWIIISHQTAQIYKLCDYVHFLSKGKLIESGTVDKIFLHSDNSIVQNFMKTQLIESENKKAGQTI